MCHTPVVICIVNRDNDQVTVVFSVIYINCFSLYSNFGYCFSFVLKAYCDYEICSVRISEV